MENQVKPLNQYKCRLCSEIKIGRAALKKHYKNYHPEHKSLYVRKAGKGTAMDIILNTANQIKNSIKDLEVERNVLSQKLLQLDETIAKYKKLI